MQTRAQQTLADARHCADLCGTVLECAEPCGSVRPCLLRVHWECVGDALGVCRHGLALCHSAPT
eukprot:562131-Alexandrium_andersonii.AAC.1